MALENASLDELTRLHQVDEVRYLTADNAAIHRAIVAFFYERYEAREMGWVWPAEFVAVMREHDPDVGTYDERTYVQHLWQLGKWRVLTSEHDLENVRTLHDLVSQARRYPITGRGRLVEEFVRQL